jgi:hypothetical protein
LSGFDDRQDVNGREIGKIKQTDGQQSQSDQPKADLRGRGSFAGTDQSTAPYGIDGDRDNQAIDGGGQGRVLAPPTLGGLHHRYVRIRRFRQRRVILRNAGRPEGLDEQVERVTMSVGRKNTIWGRDGPLVFGRDPEAVSLGGRGVDFFGLPAQVSRPFCARTIWEIPSSEEIWMAQLSIAYVTGRIPFESPNERLQHRILVSRCKASCQQLDCQD